MPVTLVEAALAGLPAVTTDVGSAGEVVFDGVTGSVVPTDVESLTAAVAGLLADDELRRRQGTAARARAGELFSVQRMVQAHRDLYADLTKQSCRRHGRGPARVSTPQAPSNSLIQDAPKFCVDVLEVSTQGRRLIRMVTAWEPAFGRRLLDVAAARMQDEPVLALVGPRSVGKSTLLNELSRRRPGQAVVDLDDPATRAAVEADPRLYVSAPGPVFIDEYQKVPSLLGAIKAELNQRTEPGRFVLTGSTRHDALPAAAESLTGRIHVMTMLPLSQGEVGGAHEDFLETLTAAPGSLVTPTASTTSRENYIDRLCAGGFPLALVRRPESRGRWFDDYVKTSLERDLQEVAPRLRLRAYLPLLLQRLASQTGQVLNVSAAGAAVDLDKSTAVSYVKLLEALFLVHRLPAWGRTLRARSTALPKVHVVDSGVAARLMRLTPQKMAQLDPAALSSFGHLLESFVVGELLKQASWSDEVAGVGHWRTHDGDEVDLVVETDGGQVFAVEVKAAGQVRSHDLRGLLKLRAALGDRLAAGVVLYTGVRSYRADERIYVLPVDRLWTPTQG